ncbi:MAG: cytochrome c biogenesis protein CcsA [Fimbriimonadia bacterium]|jgi:cytochrome c-type biogenesis protein CcmF
MLIGKLGVGLTLAVFALASLGYVLGEKYLAFARRAFRVACVLLFAVEGYLVYLLLAGRYEFEYVWQFSERNIPWYFKVSGAWAGQEGSFLLWATLTGALGLLVMTRLGKLERPFMIAYSLVLTGLAGIIAFKPPFTYHVDEATGQWLRDASGAIFVPPDGNGLVPALENYWMAIHPPIMFLGFSSLAILFCFAIAAMVRGDRKAWSVKARPWAAFSVATTGLGMCLGGFWAYETLGWGGFWAWDPVENVSLVPFLGAVAALHAIYVLNTTGRMSRASLFLCAFPFLAFLFGTFLTRSGTLAEVSVHSFDGLEHETKRLLIGMVEACTVGFVALFTWSHMARSIRDPMKSARFSRRYAALVAVGMVTLAWALMVPGAFGSYLKWPIGVWAVLMLALLVRAIFIRQPEDPERLPRKSSDPAGARLGRRQGLYAGIAAIVFIALLTLVGTSWPWIKFLLTGKSEALEPSFYESALALPGALMLLLAAIVPFLDWHKGDGGRFLNRFSVPWVAAVALAVTGFFALNIRTLVPLLFATLAFLAITANAYRIAELVKRSRVTLGGFIAHIGMAVLLLGMVVSMAFEREEKVVLEGGTPGKAFGFWVHRGDDRWLPRSSETKRMRELALHFKAGEREFTAHPEYWERWSPGREEPQRMTRPWIKRGVDNDIYVAINPPQRPETEVVSFKPGEQKKIGPLTITRLTPLQADGPTDKPGTRVTTTFRLEHMGQTIEVAPGFVLTENGIEELLAPLGNGEVARVSAVHDVDGPIGFQLVSAEELLPLTVHYKPLTSLVWLGTGIMTLGSLLSVRRRVLDSRALSRKQELLGNGRSSGNGHAPSSIAEKQNPPRTRNVR